MKIRGIVCTSIVCTSIPCPYKQALQSRLRHAGWLAGEHQVVKWARIPVFKFTDRATALPCDVSISNNGARRKS